jgi:hypothetical protein
LFTTDWHVRFDISRALRVLSHDPMDVSSSPVELKLTDESTVRERLPQPGTR